MTVQHSPEPGQNDSFAVRAWRVLAVAAVGATFLLVILGGVVRITGSGMGCGDDWPLCNGQIIPTFDLPTFLEWSHRLVAAGVSLLVAGLAAVAWKPGRGAAWTGRRRFAAAAAALLAVQVLLGAITVWLELPPASVILHLGTAMLLLATLLVAALRAYEGADRTEPRRDPVTRTGWLVAAGAFVVVLAGALVANLEAAGACRGFPLCNGQWWPKGGGAIQIQWGHRLMAYLFTVVVLFLPSHVGRRRPDDRTGQAMAYVTVGLVLSQVAVGAALVTGPLTLDVRALHLALGTAVFASAVALAWYLRRPVAAPARSRPGETAGTALSAEN